MSQSTNNTSCEFKPCRRMLSVDGGGIRGVIALEILAGVEKQLRELTGDEGLLLADWYDFIGGTSTGAIIAAGLSIGMSVDELRKLYEDNGHRMFRKAGWRERLFFSRYSHTELERILKETFGSETTMGSAKLKTLLLMVLRNATTDSPWPLTNNPKAKFNDNDLPDNNLNLPLWQVIRASTAAPTFFAPEEIRLADKKFVFVDGALTPYNNPAFMMFLNATLPEYRINWETGTDKLLLTSVGTGFHPDSAPDLNPGQMNLLYTAKSAPTALVYANLNEQDMLCRVFGKCVAGESIDAEIGDLIGSSGPFSEKAFTYARYNVDLTESGLRGIGCAHLAKQPLNQLDAVDLIAPMQEVGRAIAAQRIKREHFESHL